jgi:hypothetical protein
VESDEPVKNVDPCDDSSTGRPPNSLNSCEVSFLNVIEEKNVLTFPFFRSCVVTFFTMSAKMNCCKFSQMLENLGYSASYGYFQKSFSWISVY